MFTINCLTLLFIHLNLDDVVVIEKKTNHSIDVSLLETVIFKQEAKHSSTKISNHLLATRSFPTD